MTAAAAPPVVVAIGAINWDVTLFVEHLPTRGEEVAVSTVSRVPGGTGANVAVAAARLLAPSNVAFVGALGDDAIGDGQRAILESERITTHGITTIAGDDSGQAFILVDAGGENVIASAFGANAALTGEHIRAPSVRDMISGARVCAVTDPPLEVVEEILTVVEQGACSVFWDPGVLIDQGRDAITLLARRVDTVLLNEAETQLLMGESEPGAIAKKLQNEGWSNRIILKRGSEGSIAIDLSTGAMMIVPQFPLEEMGLAAVSSVGAGDAFHGALAALEAEGADKADALLGASCAAGLKVSRSGTRDASTRSHLDAALGDWRRRGAAIRTVEFWL